MLCVIIEDGMHNKIAQTKNQTNKQKKTARKHQNIKTAGNSRTATRLVWFSFFQRNCEESQKKVEQRGKKKRLMVYTAI